MGTYKQGWASPDRNDRRMKRHYYGANHRTLCGTYMQVAGYPQIEDDGDDNGDYDHLANNCDICKERLEAYRSNQCVMV